MEKSHCCNEDMIYLGKGFDTLFSYALDGVYHYCCSKCGRLEWASYKQKVKYKWYKYKKDKLKKLLNLESEVDL